MIKNVIKRFIYLVGCLLSPRSTRILFYHSVDNSGSHISNTPETFEKHLAYLKDNGYKSISLSEFVDSNYLENGCPDKLVLITFDDGYENNYHIAFPILKKYGFIATIFIATDFVGGDAGWIIRDGSEIKKRLMTSGEDAADVKKLKEVSGLSLLNWEQIKEMSDYGIEFGSHTASHMWLSVASPEKAKEDILRSKVLIEKMLNRPVDTFSYPYSKYTPETQELLRELGFKAACGGDPRVDSLPNDFYGLKRTGPIPPESFFEFKFIFSRAYDWYISMLGMIKGRK